MDLEARTFTFRDTKNNRPLTLPMPRYLYSVVKKRIDKGLVNKFVFPGGGPGGRYSEPKKQVAKVVDISGVKFTLHDLRRLFVTTARDLEISTYTVKLLVNHSTGKKSRDVTENYDIPSPDRLRRSMQKIEDRILTTAGAGKKGKVVPLHHAG